VELMVVVVIIGILASIAVPGVVERLRERRANQAAQEIAMLYRTARMQALGHGSAVLVRYDSGLPGFEVREAVLGATASASGCTSQPTGGCQTNDWSTATQYSVVDIYRLNRSELTSASVATSVNSPSSNGVGYMDICFSPRGRTFLAGAAGAPLTPMSGVATVNVNRGTNSIQRTVTIPPNGIARVAL
jgi:type IV fimbrial biogenesis protein FimT